MSEPNAIAVSPDGKSAYVGSGQAIDEFSRDTTTGALMFTGCIGQVSGCTVTTPANAVYGADSVVVSPDGTSVYAASFDANAIDEFSRDTSTGALAFTGCIGELTGCTPTPAGEATGPFSVAISADGASVYSAANTAQSIDQFSRDPSTGTLTLIGCTGQGSGCIATTPTDAVSSPVSVAVSPDGVNVYAGSNAASGVDVFSRNTTTGALIFQNCIGQASAGCTPTTPAGAVSASYTVTVSPDGANVYSGDGGSVLSTFTRASGTGLLTFTGCVGQLAGCATTTPAAVGDPVGVEVSPDGANVYVAGDNAESVAVFSRGTSGGALTFTGCVGQLSGCTATSPATAVDGPSDLAISPDGTSVYAGSVDANAVDLFSRAVPIVSGGGGPKGPPSSSGLPVISGNPKAGDPLSCSTGGWTNSPTSFTYQWYRDGTPLAGATSSTYLVQTLDEGTALSCAVTAANTLGTTTAQSNPVQVPIPFVPRCPGATGKLSGTTLGLVTLGATRSRERFLYRHHSNRGKRYQDFFCLTPIGVRVGYGSPKLLKSLSKREGREFLNRVVWASTSNPYYSIDGVRPGESIAVASAILHTEPPFHIGINYWYLAREQRSTVVLKVRGGVVEEIGIADNRLTKSRKAQHTLMKSFY